MAVAMIYPEPEKGGRGKKADNNYQVSRQYVSHARTIIAESSALAGVGSGLALGYQSIASGTLFFGVGSTW